MARDRHAGVSEVEREYIRAGLPRVGPPPPNGEILRHGPTWGVLGMMVGEFPVSGAAGRRFPQAGNLGFDNCTLKDKPQ